jgi:hypothetical protein
MRDFSIYTVSILNVLITIRYCWLLYKGKTKPALAMWLFFTIAVGMSLITYMANGGYSFLDNILNTTDIIYVGTVTISILIFGDKSSKFTRFDKGCLIAVLIIVIFWIITQNHIVTNFWIQGILVIAYFPVVKRLLESKENTEPFSVWFVMLLTPIISLLSSKGTLATVYSVRAIICVSLLMLLMLRIEIISRSKTQDSKSKLDQKELFE